MGVAAEKGFRGREKGWHQNETDDRSIEEIHARRCP